MKIFKFGGASVQNAQGVKNVAQIIQSHSNSNLLVVISAMGKTTNALEQVIHHCYHNTGQAHEALQTVFQYHDGILKDLFQEDDLVGVSDIRNLYLEARMFCRQPQFARRLRLFVRPNHRIW